MSESSGGIGAHWWAAGLRGFLLPGISPSTASFIQVCWAQKGSHQRFISSQLLLSLHKWQKPVGLRGIHLRGECFPKSNEKKTLCLLELFHYFCYSPSRKKQLSALALHPDGNGLCLPLLNVFLGTTGVSKAQSRCWEEKRRHHRPCHLLPAETFPSSNCREWCHKGLCLGHLTHTLTPPDTNWKRGERHRAPGVRF